MIAVIISSIFYGMSSEEILCVFVILLFFLNWKDSRKYIECQCGDAGMCAKVPSNLFAPPFSHDGPHQRDGHIYTNPKKKYMKVSAASNK